MSISPEIKLELERRARQTRDVHERLRLCVVLARSEGMSPESIAQAHRISVQSVYRYLSEYEIEAKTKHDERGGKESKLTESQTRELHDHLQKTTYLCSKEIRKYVEATYQVVYSASGMNFWLKAQEFIYKPPSNKNKKLVEYLKTSRVKIHYLPPYSPNLNPIERLWKVLREKKLITSVTKNLRILRQQYVISFLRIYQK